MLNTKALSQVLLLTMLFASSGQGGTDDSRMLVELPEMMQRHMLENMRDHMAAISEILEFLAAGESGRAADVAESRLGVSSLNKHNASHMAKFMPREMQQIGAEMHRAASRFAIKAQEGEILESYQLVSGITGKCVACHATYRIR